MVSVGKPRRLPTNLTLGWLVIEAVAFDALNQSASLLVLNVAQVVDAQANGLDLMSKVLIP